MLGTNGGGFFNANSAHPFENPSAASNLIEMVAIFAIGAALTNVFGRIAGDKRQGPRGPGWCADSHIACGLAACRTASYVSHFDLLRPEKVRMFQGDACLSGTFTFAVLTGRSDPTAVALLGGCPDSTRRTT
jgi:hypothetical protein